MQMNLIELPAIIGRYLLTIQITDLLDIAIMVFVLYKVLILVQSTKAASLLKGLFVFFAALLFSSALAVGLVITSRSPSYLTIILILLLLAVVHSVNWYLVDYLPLFFAARHIVATLVGACALATGTAIPGNCTHEPSQLTVQAGANIIWAERGSSPRDITVEATRGLSVNDCRSIYAENEWKVREGASRFYS